MQSRPTAFISYSHADRDEVIPLASYFDRLGLQVWMDTKDLTGGESIIEAVSEAISAADIYVVCLSPASVGSTWVRHELDLAMSLEVERGSPRVLPILLTTTEIPVALRGRLYIDVSSSADAGKADIQQFVVANVEGVEGVEEESSALVIGSVELELSKSTALSYGGANPEASRTEVEAEGQDIANELAQRAHGILLNFVPAKEIDLGARHFQFPNGEITTRVENEAGKLTGTAGKKIAVAVEVLNPSERKLDELVSSSLEALGVCRISYLFLIEPPIVGLAERAFAYLQQSYVLIGWDPARTSNSNGTCGSRCSSPTKKSGSGSRPNIRSTRECGISRFANSSNRLLRTARRTSEMLRIDAAFLAELQLEGLPAEEANLLLRHVYETLELRVGVRLAGRMSPSQLDEFEACYEAGDDQRALEWLEENFPNYRDVVHEEFYLLQEELRETAPTIQAMRGRGV
jgi:TIR domain/Protein of unknown function (DUF5663)